MVNLSHQFSGVIPWGMRSGDTSAEKLSVSTSYHPLIVVMSFFVSVFGSFTTLQIVYQTRYAKSRASILGWLLTASITLGVCAVWSMHFLGMASLSIEVNGTNVPIMYDTFNALLSAFVACVSCGIGLFISTLHLFCPRWIRYWQRACPATRHHRHQSQSLKELRMVHYDRRKLMATLFDINCSEDATPCDTELLNDMVSTSMDRDSSCIETPVGMSHTLDEFNGYYSTSSTACSELLTSTSSHSSSHNHLESTSSHVPTAATAAEDEVRYEKPNDEDNSINNHIVSTISEPEGILLPNHHHPLFQDPIESSTTHTSSHSAATYDDTEESDSDENEGLLSVEEGNYNHHSMQNWRSSSPWGSTRQKVKKMIKGSMIGDRNRPHCCQLLVAALFTASGVAGMHYMGMASMRVEKISMEYNPFLVFLSLVIAYVASGASLWISFNMNSELKQIVSSLVMGLAICGMHYTGQWAVEYYASAGHIVVGNSSIITNNQLPLFVVLSTCIVCFLLVVLISSNSRNRRNLEVLVQNLNREMEVSDKLLLNILPMSIAMRMKNGESNISEKYDNCTVILCDIVQFTHLCSRVDPSLIVCLLHELFSLFDESADRLGLEKIKTIGDAYLAVAGLSKSRGQQDHAVLAISYGSEMIRIVNSFNREYIQGHTRSSADSLANPRRSGGILQSLTDTTTNDQTDPLLNSDLLSQIPDSYRNGLQIRVGVHSGSLVGGVVGSNKFLFDIFGPTVNMASRMESTGVPMKIQVSQETYELTKQEFQFEKRDNILLKGIGVQSTYITDGVVIKEPLHIMN